MYNSLFVYFLIYFFSFFVNFAFKWNRSSPHLEIFNYLEYQTACSQNSLLYAATSELTVVIKHDWYGLAAVYLENLKTRSPINLYCCQMVS